MTDIFDFNIHAFHHYDVPTRFLAMFVVMLRWLMQQKFTEQLQSSRSYDIAGGTKMTKTHFLPVLSQEAIRETQSLIRCQDLIPLKGPLNKKRDNWIFSQKLFFGTWKSTNTAAKWKVVTFM